MIAGDYHCKEALRLETFTCDGCVTCSDAPHGSEVEKLAYRLIHHLPTVAGCSESSSGIYSTCAGVFLCNGFCVMAFCEIFLVDILLFALCGGFAFCMKVRRVEPHQLLD